jgi:hypothetical protein
MTMSRAQADVYIYIYIYIYIIFVVIVIVIVVVWHIIGFLEIIFTLTPGCQYGSPLPITSPPCLYNFNIIKPLMFKFVLPA